MNEGLGIKETCFQIGITNAIYLTLYTVFAIWVYCTQYNEDVEQMVNDDSARRQGDELDRILKTLHNESLDEKRQLINKRRE